MRQINSVSTLSDFLAEVVMTSYYLAEPPAKSAGLLHDAEMKCLKIIAVFGPMQMRDVAAALHVTKPRVTKLVTDLCERGFIEWTTGQDKRAKLVTVTADGRDLVVVVRQRYHDLALNIESKLGAAKTRRLQQLLAEITPLTDFHATINHKG